MVTARDKKLIPNFNVKYVYLASLYQFYKSTVHFAWSNKDNTIVYSKTQLIIFISHLELKNIIF